MGNSQKAQFLGFREGAVRPPLPQSSPGQNRSKVLSGSSWHSLCLQRGVPGDLEARLRAASVVTLEESPRTAFVLYSPVLGAVLTGPGAPPPGTVLGAVLASSMVVRPPVEPGLHRNSPTPRQAATRSDAVLQISEIRIAATLRASAWRIPGCCSDRPSRDSIPGISALPWTPTTQAGISRSGPVQACWGLSPGAKF